VVANAYQMCNGLLNALPNTHSTITATLTIESLSPGILLVPSATTSSYSSSSSMTTSTSPQPTSSLITVTSSPTLTPGTTSATGTSNATSSATTLAAAQKPSTNVALSESQIAGIVVAGVGGAVIVIGLIILLACIRRKRSGRDSDTLPFQMDPATPQSYGGGFQGPIEKNAKQGWNNTPTPPRVPPRIDTSDPYMFSRRSIYPDNIGLAVSPEKPDPVVKRPSPLLPEKPNLRLVMPPTAPVKSAGQWMARQQRVLPARQSTTTQFEDDLSDSATDIDTAFSESGGNILKAIEVFPTPPRNQAAKQTANIFTFPNNENGDSRLVTQQPNPAFRLVPAPGLVVKPLNLNKQGVGSFSRPRPNAEAPSQQEALEVPNNLRPITQSSSVYSQQTPNSTHTSFSNTPSTGPLSSNFPETKTKADARNPESYKQVGPYDRASAGSLTSFDSEGFSDDENASVALSPRGARKSTMELSPVEESPSSGISPVSYPKITPPGRLAAQTMKMVPPPPQPDFTSVFHSRANLNENRDNYNHWRAPENAAQRQRSQRRDELRLSRATRPSPQVSGLPELLPAAQIIEMSNVRPEKERELGNSSNYNAPFAHPTIPNSLSAVDPQQQSQPGPPLSQPQVQPLRQKLVLRPGAAHLKDRSRSSSPASTNSTTSSLLAKRLGADKAAALHLAQKPDVRDTAKTGWRVLKQDDIQAAKDPGWRPQLLQQVTKGANHGQRFDKTPKAWNGDRARESRATEGEMPSSKSVRFDVDAGREGKMPPTPGWVPKLTPTRRGDELFLSVQ